MIPTWVLRGQLRRCLYVGTSLLVCGAHLPTAWAPSTSPTTVRPVPGAPVGGDVVYGVGEEFTVQTDASLVQLAHTSPRENVAAVEKRLGAWFPRGLPLIYLKQSPTCGFCVFTLVVLGCRAHCS